MNLNGKRRTEAVLDAGLSRTTCLIRPAVGVLDALIRSCKRKPSKRRHETGWPDMTMLFGNAKLTSATLQQIQGISDVVVDAFASRDVIDSVTLRVWTALNARADGCGRTKRTLFEFCSRKRHDTKRVRIEIGRYRCSL